MEDFFGATVALAMVSAIGFAFLFGVFHLGAWVFGCPL